MNSKDIFGCTLVFCIITFLISFFLKETNYIIYFGILVIMGQNYWYFENRNK